MSRGTELEHLNRSLRRTRWWALLATLSALGLGATACLLGGWLLAFVQSNPQLFALATPVWPTPVGYGYAYGTPTPYYPYFYSPPYSNYNLPPLWPYPASLPANATGADVLGTGEFTLTSQETRSFVLQSTYPLAARGVAELSIWLIPSDPNVSPPLEMKVWNRVNASWDVFTPVWGQNAIPMPEYYVGLAGEVFIEFGHYANDPVTLHNVSLQMVLLGNDGYLFYVPFAPTPTPYGLSPNTTTPVPTTDAATPSPLPPP